jgi:hypothetical protein
VFYLFEKGHRKKLDELAEVLVEQDLHIGWIKRWDLMLEEYICGQIDAYRSTY